MQKPFTQSEGGRKIREEKTIKAHSQLAALAPEDPGSWIHSPFSPWEKRFVSCAGLWCVVFVRGASTGGLLVAVGQTEGPGPATDQGRVTTAAGPAPGSPATTATASSLSPTQPRQKRPNPSVLGLAWSPRRPFSAKSPAGPQRTWA